jgi:hypothetical protein
MYALFVQYLICVTLKETRLICWPLLTAHALLHAVGWNCGCVCAAYVVLSFHHSPKDAAQLGLGVPRDERAANFGQVGAGRSTVVAELKGVQLTSKSSVRRAGSAAPLDFSVRTHLAWYCV